MKTCNKCGVAKDLSEFYRHSGGGYRGYCKGCYSAIAKDYREKNSDSITVAKRAWRVANPDKVAAQWQRNVIRHPDRKKARTAVATAIAAGKLIKVPCEVCGNLDVHGHHDDYSRPLAVRWLCQKHHTEHHLGDKAPAVPALPAERKGSRTSRVGQRHTRGTIPHKGYNPQPVFLGA